MSAPWIPRGAVFFVPEPIFKVFLNIFEQEAGRARPSWPSRPGELLWRRLFQTMASHGVQSAGLHAAVWDDGDT